MVIIVSHRWMGCVITTGQYTSSFDDKRSNDSAVQSHKNIVNLIDDIKEIEKRFGDEQEFVEVKSSNVLIDTSHPELSISIDPDEIPHDTMIRKIHGEQQFIEVWQSSVQNKKPDRASFPKTIDTIKKKILSRLKNLHLIGNFEKNSDGSTVPATFSLHIDDYGNLVGLHPPLSKQMQKVVSLIGTIMKRLPNVNLNADTIKKVSRKIQGIFSFLPFVKSPEKKSSSSARFLEKLKGIIPKFGK